jgi:hypothetical protein
MNPASVFMDDPKSLLDLGIVAFLFITILQMAGMNKNHELEAHYAVPPHWEPRNHNSSSNSSRMSLCQPPPPPPPRLVMVVTLMREPDCPNDWCATMDSVKWECGPGEEDGK